MPADMIDCRLRSALFAVTVIQRLCLLYFILLLLMRRFFAALRHAFIRRYYGTVDAFTRFRAR